MLPSFSVLALAPPPGDGAPGNPLLQFVPFLLVIVVFYFLVFAPMRRKQKKHSEMLQALKAGDRIMTSGGLFGRVVAVEGDVVHLRIADQVKVEVAKHAVASVIGADQ